MFFTWLENYVVKKLWRLFIPASISVTELLSTCKSCHFLPLLYENSWGQIYCLPYVGMWFTAKFFQLMGPHYPLGCPQLHTECSGAILKTIWGLLQKLLVKPSLWKGDQSSLPAEIVVNVRLEKWQQNSHACLLRLKWNVLSYKIIVCKSASLLCQLKKIFIR